MNNTPNKRQGAPSRTQKVNNGAGGTPQRAVPQSGRAVPQGGKTVPQNGRAVPQGGKAVPQSGRSVPQGGRTVPQGGRRSVTPSGGRNIPQSGRNVPQSGRNVPQSGSSEYYLLIANTLRTLKWASIIAVFLLVVATFVIYRHEMTLENLRYVMRYVNFDIGTDYRTSNQISYRAEPDTEYAYLKGDLAMVGPTRFSVYEFTGQALVDDRISYLNPAIKTNGRYALIYDVTGTELALYNSNGCLFEKDFTYGIKDAAVRNDGVFAVVSSESFVSSSATVYGANYTDDYTVTTTDKEIISASLPNGAGRLDLLMFHASEGDFLIYVRSYDLRSENASHSAEVQLRGEYPLRMVSTKDSVAVLTDRAIRFYGKDLSAVSEFSFGSAEPLSFYEDGNYIVLVLDGGASENGDVRVFSKDGRELVHNSLDGGIIDFASEGDSLYILEEGRLHIMTESAEGVLYEASVRELGEDTGYTDVFAMSGSKYILASRDGAGKFE